MELKAKDSPHVKNAFNSVKKAFITFVELYNKGLTSDPIIPAWIYEEEHRMEFEKLHAEWKHFRRTVWPNVGYVNMKCSAEDNETPDIRAIIYNLSKLGKYFEKDLKSCQPWTNYTATMQIFRYHVFVYCVDECFKMNGNMDIRNHLQFRNAHAWNPDKDSKRRGRDRKLENQGQGKKVSGHEKDNLSPGDEARNPENSESVNGEVGEGDQEKRKVKCRELRQLDHLFRISFSTSADTMILLEGVKALQAEHNLTDEEVLESFWNARLRCFHWEVDAKRVIGQLIFILEKYNNVLEEFCSTEGTFQLHMTVIRKFPHLLFGPPSPDTFPPFFVHPSMVEAAVNFFDRLVECYNGNVNVNNSYRELLSDLVDRYIDFIDEDNEAEWIRVKAIVLGFSVLPVEEYSAFLKSFIEGFHSKLPGFK